MNDLYQQRFRIAGAALLMTMLLACDEAKTPEQHLRDATEFHQQGELSSAVIELKNALKNSPEHAGVRLLLGNIYLEQGQLLNAEKELLRAQQFGALTPQLLMPLARVSLQLGKFSETVDLLGSLSALASGEQIVAHVLKGQALLALGRDNEAAAEFTMANEINEGHHYSQFGQALLASSQEDFEKSTGLLEGVLAESPDMLEALFLYGNLSFAKGEYVNAIGAFKRYLELQPTASHIHLILANSYLENKQYDEAETLVQELLKLNESHAFANYLGARIAISKEQFLPALEYAERSLSTVSNNYPAKLIAGLSAHRLGRTEQAYQHLLSIQDQMPSGHAGRKVLAVLKLKLGYAEDASRDFTALEGLQAADAPLLAAASLQLAQAGNLDSASAMIERATTLEPDNARLKAQEGILKLAMNDVSGLEILEDAATDITQSQDVELYLALNYLKKGQPQKARDIAIKWQLAQPEQPEGWLLSGLIEAREKRYEKARRAFEQVLELNPKHGGAMINLSLLAEQQGDLPLALKYAKQMVAVNPVNELALIRRATVLGLMENSYQPMIDSLVAASSDLPGAMKLRVTLATAYVRAGQTEKAIAVLEQVDRQVRQPAAYWQAYGDVLQQSRQYPQALDVFAQWAAQYPNMPQALMRQLGALELMNKPAEALRLIDSVSERFGKLPALKMMRASFLMLNNNLADSRQALNRLKKEPTPIKASFLLGLEGELLFREGSIKEAVPVLDKAYRMTKQPRFAKLLVSAYLEQGLPASAISLLERHLEEFAGDSGSRVMLAALYTQSDPAKSVEQYHLLLKSSPDNPVFLNNLAWQLAEQGQLEEAETFAHKAVELLPENPNILDTYGVILQKMKQQDKALKTLIKAQQLSPENVAISLHLAQAWLDKGSRSQANSVLNRVNNATDAQKEEISRLRKLALTDS